MVIMWKIGSILINEYEHKREQFHQAIFCHVPRTYHILWGSRNIIYILYSTGLLTISCFEPNEN